MTVTHQFVTDLAELLSQVATVDESPHPRPIVLPTVSYEVATAAGTVLTPLGIQCMTVTARISGVLTPALALGDRDEGFTWPT